MCDVKAQEDEGPEEGEIQDEDDEEASLCLSSSSYDRDIRNHERQRAARKYFTQDSTGSLNMSIVNDRMLSRTNHERRDKSRVRPKHSEGSHHKTSGQPWSGLTHGKENRHVHQSREVRSPLVPQSGRSKSKTPDGNSRSRDHTKTTGKRHRSVSSRSSEGAGREPDLPLRKKTRRRGGVKHKRRSTPSVHADGAKKSKGAHNRKNNGDLNNDASNNVMNGVEANEENSLKRKLWTMGALGNQSQPVSTLPSGPVLEVEPEDICNNSVEIEVAQPPSGPQISPEKSSEAVSKGGKGVQDGDNGVIFIAAVPKSVPVLVTLSDSDAEQDMTLEVENVDGNKGTTDMEMSRSSASSNVDMDLESTILEVPLATTSASAVEQPDQEDDDIMSLRRAALMSKNKPTKDPPCHAEQEEDDLQLRVAALRSAVMRKAEVRKKRRMQSVGQFLGDETTPVDMDLADTDEEEEESQPQSSPEPPPLPLPPMPSESLLKTINMPAAGCYFPDPVAPTVHPPSHFMPSFLEPVPNQGDNLPWTQITPEVTADPLGHPSEMVVQMDCEGIPLVGPRTASFPEPGFPGHTNEFSAPVQAMEYPVHDFAIHPTPIEFPVHPVPPPAPPEYPCLPLDYPPPPVPSEVYPVNNVEYQPEPSVDYDPAVPTPYPESSAFAETAEPAQTFIPEEWDQEDQPSGPLEPLSQILTKAMRKKIQNSRPNLLEIKVTQPPSKKDNPESDVASFELFSMVVLDEVTDSPVSSPVLSPADKNIEVPTGLIQRQASIDEDEMFLREKLLKAISSKRDQSQPQEKAAGGSTKPADESTKPSDKSSRPPEKSQSKDKEPVVPPASRPKNKEPVPPLTAKPKTSADVISKDRQVYSKDNQKVSVQPRQTFPVRKTEKPKQKTAPPVFQQLPTARFIIQLGEDSDSSDGLDGTEEPEDLNLQRKETLRRTNMYHVKDYCPRTGAGDSETSKPPDESASQGAVTGRCESDLSKQVDKFLKDVRTSHEASTPAPDSPMATQVTVLKPIHVTPLAVRHLPASKQEEYRKLKQMIAERELQKKTQKKTNVFQAQTKVAPPKNAAQPAAVNEPSKVQPVPVTSTSPKTSTPPKASTTTKTLSPRTPTTSVSPKTLTPTPPKRPFVPESTTTLKSPAPLPLNRLEGAGSSFKTAKTVMPFSERATLNRANNPEFFRGVPIMYGHSATPTIVAPGSAPKIPVAVAQPIRDQVRAGGQAKPSSALTAATSAPSAPMNQQYQEKQLEEAEMNLLKERSAVVGQIMGLTRLQDETENAMAAQDVRESNLLRILDEFDKECKEWLESAIKVKTMVQNVKGKRDQLRGSYARTERLAKSCRSLGAQVKGTAYTLPVGIMMQSKQKAANQQFGRLVKWRKEEQKRMRCIIDKTDMAYAFLKSRCQQPPTVRVNPTPISAPVSTVAPIPAPIPIPAALPTPPPLLPSRIILTTPQPTTPVSETKKGCLPSPLPVPETPKIAASQGQENAEPELKNTPSVFCARRLVRVAKRRLRDGGKPREIAKQPKMILGKDYQPAEEMKMFLTKYTSPLVHLGSAGSDDAFFDPEAILCPYELNGKCEDDECLYQHQAKDTNRES